MAKAVVGVPPIGEVDREGTLTRGSVIRGRLINDHGKSCAGLGVTVESTDDETAGIRVSSTDAAGRFVFKDRRPRRYSLSIRKRYGTPVKLRCSTILYPWDEHEFVLQVAEGERRSRNALPASGK